MTAEEPIPGLTNLHDLYVAPGGGPIHRLARRHGLWGSAHRAVPRRILALILITWVPMCVFAWLQGSAFGPSPRGSFMLDYATYARYFVCIPLLIVADRFIGAELAVAGMQFVRDGLVGPDDYPAFGRAIARLARRRESTPVFLVLVALSLCGAWKFTFKTVGMKGITGWDTLDLAGGSSLAGLWYHLIALPIALFLLYRWLWRVLSWGLFLRDVASLNLELTATHADRAGGLGFLEAAHKSFCLLAFGINCIPSAEAAFRMVHEGARLGSFEVLIVVLIIATEIIFLGPLMVFAPSLARAKRAGLLQYGRLANRYNRGFHAKWVEGSSPESEPLLGSADVQSLADMGNSYRFVSEMGVTPFSRSAILWLAIAAALPFAPLLFLEMPFAEILNSMAKMVL